MATEVVIAERTEHAIAVEVLAGAVLVHTWVLYLPQVEHPRHPGHAEGLVPGTVTWVPRTVFLHAIRYGRAATLGLAKVPS